MADFRALSDADIARWANEWTDNGLLSSDILLISVGLLIAAIPFFFIYWSWYKVIFSRNYRMYIRSGENGMPIIQFVFALFVGTTIINDIFFAILFSGPLWAVFYSYAGIGLAVDIENAVSMFRATAILFGAWS